MFMVNIFFSVKRVKIYIALCPIFENHFFTSINNSSIVFYGLQEVITHNFRMKLKSTSVGVKSELRTNIVSYFI